MAYYQRCENCARSSDERTTTTVAGTGPHAFKQICPDCQKFIRWVPKAVEAPAHADTKRYYPKCSQ